MRKSPTAPSNPLRWFPEFLEVGRRRLRPQVRLLSLSLAVGIISGIGAVAFYIAGQAVFHYSLSVLSGYHPLHPGGEPELFGTATGALRPWLLLVVPTLGGLCSGLLVFSVAPEAEGHGTDAAIDSYHYSQGQIRPRVPLVKLIASAITLGTGGSGGREGPIAQIGAGFGSFLGGVLGLRPAERRVLLAAGMGAGIAAIFRAPLAGALFAAEVLYRSPEFESEVILPAALSSIIAYCTFGIFFGWQPLFTLDEQMRAVLTFEDPLQLLPYTLLAVLLAVLAMVYTRSFYALTYLFHRLPLPRHIKPALGAFLTGAVGLALYYSLGRELHALSVMSFGYGVLQYSLDLVPGSPVTLHLALLLVLVALGKILTTGLTIGSGGSGGVFGPSMVIGGCAGGSLGLLLHHLVPSVAPPPAAFTLVGMAGFFAAAAKTPFSTLVMVSELTGNYNLLLPTLWVCALAFLLSDEQSIYSAQVETRARSPAHQGEYVRDVLAGLRVQQFIIPVAEIAPLRPGDSLATVVERLGHTSYNSLPVADESEVLVGMISLEEVLLAAQSPHLQSLVVAADMVRANVVPLQPELSLDRALELFVESDLLALPVVADLAGRRLLGLVKRADISTTYLRQVQGMSAGSGAS